MVQYADFAILISKSSLLKFELPVVNYRNTVCVLQIIANFDVIMTIIIRSP